MSESTRTLKDEPIGWYACASYRGTAVMQWALFYWDGNNLYSTDNPGALKCSPPETWDAIRGPLVDSSDFMQREDVKRWKEIEDLARTFCEESTRPNTTDWHFVRGQLEALLDPPVPFTPPPKPEPIGHRLYRRDDGVVQWFQENRKPSWLWTEIDQVTGHQISAKEQG